MASFKGSLGELFPSGLVKGQEGERPRETDQCPSKQVAAWTGGTKGGEGEESGC